MYHLYLSFHFYKEVEVTRDDTTIENSCMTRVVNADDARNVGQDRSAWRSVVLCLPRREYGVLHMHVFMYVFKPIFMKPPAGSVGVGSYTHTHAPASDTE